MSFLAKCYTIVWQMLSSISQNSDMQAIVMELNRSKWSSLVIAGVRLANTDAHECPLINSHELARYLASNLAMVFRAANIREISFRAFVI